jgi:2-iminobutanoate/2-iminopropanoate deaminase
VASAHPYSPAFAAGGLIYVSGALSVDVAGVAVDVVKTTYFVTDISLRDEANEQYERVFSQPRPARSFVGVAALPYGATVEIEAVAMAPLPAAGSVDAG